jgi:kynurenine formamidase
VNAPSGGFRAVGAALSNWGRWGADDQLGTLNLLTPERVVRAAGLVTLGLCVPLGLPFDEEGPQLPGGDRFNPVHVMLRTGASDPAPGGFLYTDDVIAMPTQCGTQLDALAHVAYDGAFYNGWPTSSVTENGASRLGVEAIRCGIQGRGVLLDIARHRGVDHLPAEDEVGVPELLACAAAQDVTVREGDLLLIRTGWIRRHVEDGDRAGFLTTEPGLALSTARWLHDTGVALVGVDNWGVEAVGATPPAEAMPLHCVLIRDMGMPLAEMLDLESLSRACAEHSRWEFHLRLDPLPITGGVGSPIAPIATL